MPVLLVPFQVMTAEVRKDVNKYIKLINDINIIYLNYIGVLHICNYDIFVLDIQTLPTQVFVVRVSLLLLISITEL